jgi:3-oxoacyl-[acyl-carrier protein] reductase
MTDPIMSLAGKSIIVTGAAQGIGRGVAELALELGATVTAIDLNGGALEEFSAKADQDRLLTRIGSVADVAFAQSAVAEAIEKFGAVHGLVNNAGMVRPAMIEKMTIEQWQAVIDVHLSGSFYFLQAVGRHMIERAKAGDKAPGSIVNISSDAGRKGTIGQINYGAAKSGLLGLTMSAAREWGRHGIRVNSAVFGVVVTPMTEVIRGEKFRDNMLAQIPLGRWAETEEVTRPICFLLSDAASYITGQHISVNGGYTINV